MPADSTFSDGRIAGLAGDSGHHRVRLEAPVPLCTPAVVSLTVVVLQALQSAVAAVRRNPVLFVAAAAFSLLQLPGLLAQFAAPLVGGLLSLGFSAVSLFVMPFLFGGLIGMANEALGGRTSFETFVSEAKTHYVSILVVYLALFGINLVMGIALFFGLLLAGVALYPGGGESVLLAAIVAFVGLVALAGYLLVIFTIQFFGHAIVVDDLDAVASIKRSAWCVRHNLLAVLGYTLLTAVGGAVFGLVGGLFSLLTSPTSPGADIPPSAPAASHLPVAVPSVGIAGTVGLLVVLLVATALFGGFFAAFSTAFYRAVRPASA